MATWNTISKDVRGAWRQAGFDLLYMWYSGGKEALKIYSEICFGSDAKYCI